jgi:predicted RNA-binding protein (virulence factor B family)
MDPKLRVPTGKTQTLRIFRLTPYGAYVGLPDMDPDYAVLLPKKQVPENAREGDDVTVFTYRDSEDRPVATVRRPFAEAGEFACLRVKAATKIGAFLEWGLEKDLFVPFKEQEEKLDAGREVMVYIYLDKADRLLATTRIYDHLSPAPKGAFRKNDEVAAAVYRTQRDFGVFAAVLPKGETVEQGRAYRELYFGLVPKEMVFTKYRVGDAFSGRVIRVREDGKLDLSTRKRAFEQLDADGEVILRKAMEYGGELPFSDSASPEIVKRELGMSRNAFKRALGHLYKEHRVEILEDSVRVLRDGPQF